MPTVKEGEQIGRRIAEIRAAAGIDAKDAAKALGLKESSYYAIEDGRNTKGFVRLANLAHILGTTPNVILGVESEPANYGGLVIDTFRALLPELGYPAPDAERLCEIVSEALREKEILDVDRRLQVRSLAVSQMRRASLARWKK